MSLTIGGVVVDKFVNPPQISDKFRARSVEYTLDGTAKEDRLGGTKREIKLPFGVLSSAIWDTLKEQLSQETIPVSGFVGHREIRGTFRLVEDEVPTPVLYVSDNGYVTKPFTVSLEEV